MSFRRKSFSVGKTPSRRTISHSQLRQKFSAEQLAREFGSPLKSIDIRIGDEKLVYDTTHGDWTMDGTATGSSTISAREMNRLETTKRELTEENDHLRAKIELLIEMLAEINAEEELRRKR